MLYGWQFREYGHKNLSICKTLTGWNIHRNHPKNRNKQIRKCNWNSSNIIYKSQFSMNSPSCCFGCSLRAQASPWWFWMNIIDRHSFQSPRRYHHDNSRLHLFIMVSLICIFSKKSKIWLKQIRAVLIFKIMNSSWEQNHAGPIKGHILTLVRR